MKTHISSPLSLALLLSSLVLLPGCAPINWIKEKLGVKGGVEEAACPVSHSANGSDVLATMGGKPLMTVAEFEKDFNEFVEKHPLGAVLKQMEGVDYQIFNGLLSQRLISKWAEINKIRETKEYQDNLKQLQTMLDAKHFEMQHQPKLNDNEIKAFYDEKKDMIPEVLVSRGGVNTMGIEFAKEADAKAFLEKVKAKPSEFAKIAKDAKLGDKVRDFKLVNAQSVGIEAPVREKVVTFTKFPTVELIKAGDKYWVVYSSGKEETKYRPFDQVKAIVQERATMEKQREAFEKGVEQLKKDMDVVINQEYFSKKKQAAPQPVDAQGEQLEAVMPSANADKAPAKAA